MLYRDGSTSTFPSSLDHFQINSAIGASGFVLPTALERSAIVNQYFDAALNLERFLVKIANLPLVGLLPHISGSSISSSRYSSNVKMEQTKINVPLSGYTASGGVTVSLTVPSSTFGVNPFLDPSFTITITPELTGFDNTYQPIANRANYLRSIANEALGANISTGPYNQLLQIPFIYHGVCPVSSNATGTNYNVFLNMLGDSFIQSQIIGNYNEDWVPVGFTWPYTFKSVWNYNWNGAAAIVEAHSGYWTYSHTPAFDKWSLGYNLTGNNGNGAAALFYTPTLPRDHEIEFQVDRILFSNSPASGVVAIMKLNCNSSVSVSGWLPDRAGEQTYTLSPSSYGVIKYLNGFGNFNYLDTDSTVVTTGSVNSAPMFIYKTCCSEGRPYDLGQKFGYAFNGFTPNQTYLLRLHFAEIVPGRTTGVRHVWVDVNNENVIAAMDVYQEAGGLNRSLVKDLYVQADSTGQVVVDFYNPASSEGGIINGIEFYTTVSIKGFGGPCVNMTYDTSTPLYVYTGLCFQVGSASGSPNANSDGSANSYNIVALFKKTLYYPSPSSLEWAVAPQDDVDSAIFHLIKNAPLKTRSDHGTGYKYKLSIIGTVLTVYTSSNDGATWTVDNSVDYATVLPEPWLSRMQNPIASYSLSPYSSVKIGAGIIANTAPIPQALGQFNFLPIRLSDSPHTSNNPQIGLSLNIMYTKIGSNTDYNLVKYWPRNGWVS